jgi:glycosyltransferase involved in cell wall biosynthesis
VGSIIDTEIARPASPPKRSGGPTFSIVVPALNEEANLVPAVEAIIKTFGSDPATCEVLVFDDASTDRTGERADELARRFPNVRAFHNRTRLNIGGIYHAGLRYARHRYYLLLPGDNEVAIEGVLAGVTHLGRADIVLSYTVNPEVRPPLRRFLSRAYVIAVNLIFGTHFRYTNGSNILRTDLVRRLDLTATGFSYQTEALVKAVRSGTDFAEYGIRIRERGSGKPTALRLRNWVNVARAVGRLWWDVRVVHRPRYRQRGRRVSP